VSEGLPFPSAAPCKPVFRQNSDRPRNNIHRAHNGLRCRGSRNFSNRVTKIPSKGVTARWLEARAFIRISLAEQCDGDHCRGFRGVFLTDGGLETTLIFHDKLELPYFAAFHLLKDRAGSEALRKYYCSYASIACTNGLGFVLESPTWRANLDWSEKLGYSSAALADVNRLAVTMMRQLRGQFQTPSSASRSLSSRWSLLRDTNRIGTNCAVRPLPPREFVPLRDRNIVSFDSVQQNLYPSAIETT